MKEKITNIEQKLNILNIDCKSVFEKLVNFISTKVNEAGFKKIILGLSGGVDSSLVAFLCKEALGASNVLGIRLPYKVSSAESLMHAELVCKKTNIEMITFDITKIAEGFLQSNFTINTSLSNFRSEFKNILNIDKNEILLENVIDKYRLGNILARIRMCVLYDFSAMFKGIVVGTSNKTEILLGYGTLWGDLAYGINPVGNLYKYQIRMLAKYVGVPDEIILKKPSADLFPGQTDEGDFGFSYDEIDYTLYNLVELNKSAQSLTNEVDQKLVDFCINKMKTMEFKRQMPPIAKI